MRQQDVPDFMTETLDDQEIEENANRVRRRCSPQVPRGTIDRSGPRAVTRAVNPVPTLDELVGQGCLVLMDVKGHRYYWPAAHDADPSCELAKAQAFFLRHAGVEILTVLLTEGVR